MAILVGCAFGLGCAQTWVKVREVPVNPLAGPLKLLSPGGPQPTPRTMLLLRRYDLEGDLKHDEELLGKLNVINERDPTAEKLYSIAELAYLAGKRAETMSRRHALELHGLAVVNAYNYLFDPRCGQFRNPYDPEFRGACDLYNGALESTLRIVKKQGGLTPGTTHTIRTANQTVEATIVLRGNGWRSEDIEGFRFVSDYDIRGLQNQYHNYGLGVPLIAIRKHHDPPAADDKFYPPGMSFPVTAFWRVLPDQGAGDGRHVALIELYDPLNTAEIKINGKHVPLESDLTTPLAYALNQKQLRDLDSSTAGLLDPDKTEKLRGLYMLEPYQPGKIPVLMVHGLWSSPITWMQMFNDLRGAPEIRERYQFWFYLYPSGQPFWISAAQLRSDLAEARTIIDPQRQQPALDQMVMVGHSMGGLVAEMQTIESREDFWRIMTDKPFSDVKASEQVRRELADVFFFQPNPSVRRVITLGTPFRGSTYANSTTRWLGEKLIKLPQMLIAGRQQLLKDNPDLFRDSKLIEVNTSIDSLSPESPILPVMLTAQRARWIKYHNIVGKLQDKGIVGRMSGEGDGVVSFASAHLDNVTSELVVNSDHTTINRHPLSVLEVHRILLEHLRELDGTPNGFPRKEHPPLTASRGGNPLLPYPAAVGGAPVSGSVPQGIAPASGLATMPGAPGTPVIAVPVASAEVMFPSPGTNPAVVSPPAGAATRPGPPAFNDPASRATQPAASGATILR